MSECHINFYYYEYYLNRIRNDDNDVIEVKAAINACLKSLENILGQYYDIDIYQMYDVDQLYKFVFIKIYSSIYRIIYNEFNNDKFNNLVEETKVLRSLDILFNDISIDYTGDFINTIKIDNDMNYQSLIRRLKNSLSIKKSVKKNNNYIEILKKVKIKNTNENIVTTTDEFQKLYYFMYKDLYNSIIRNSLNPNFDNELINYFLEKNFGIIFAKEITDLIDKYRIKSFYTNLKSIIYYCTTLEDIFNRKKIAEYIIREFFKGHKGQYELLEIISLANGYISEFILDNVIKYLRIDNKDNYIVKKIKDRIINYKLKESFSNEFHINTSNYKKINECNFLKKIAIKNYTLPVLKCINLNEDNNDIRKIIETIVTEWIVTNGIDINVSKEKIVEAQLYSILINEVNKMYKTKAIDECFRDLFESIRIKYFFNEVEEDYNDQYMNSYKRIVHKHYKNSYCDSNCELMLSASDQFSINIICTLDFIFNVKIFFVDSINRIKNYLLEVDKLEWDMDFDNEDLNVIEYKSNNKIKYRYLLSNDQLIKYIRKQFDDITCKSAFQLILKNFENQAINSKLNKVIIDTNAILRKDVICGYYESNFDPEYIKMTKTFNIDMMLIRNEIYRVCNNLEKNGIGINKKSVFDILEKI